MGAVQHSAEIDRVLQIPRRRWTPAETDTLVRDLSAALRVRGSSATLRPLQAIALAEIGIWRGGFFPIPVGGGKTLLSGLAARMVPVQRPLILVPAHLLEKTEAEFRAYRRDWVLPHLLRVQTYQTLSRVGSADFLDQYQPDLIFADEADYIKNTSAAVTRRVGRYLNANPSTIFVAATGTPWDRSITEVCHLAAAALKRNNPFPTTHHAIDEWSRALDVDVSDARALDPGALMALAEDGETHHEAFRRRLLDTPGIVMSQDPPLPIPLEVTTVIGPCDAAQAEAFHTLRRWQTPDGIEIEDAPAMWRHAREVASGFYSVWDPRPPTDWREARGEWARTCRDLLSSNRRNLDSELQLRQAMAAHPEWYPEAVEILARWVAIEPTFTPNPVPVWISDSVIDFVASWALERPGLIWTDRPAFGERLRARYGIPYYGEMGVDTRTGRYVESHKAAEGSICLSRPANDTGRNLQFQWARNLIVDIPPSGRRWEQLLGRTHRPGQEAPRVTAEVLVGCVEDLEALGKAIRRNDWAESITGQVRKLTHAEVSIASPPDPKADRWKKSLPPESA